MDLLTRVKALADETRLRLFTILSEHELRVGELVQVLEMGQSRISRHLKIMAECGLLSSRRDGLWVFYSLGDASHPFIAAMLPLLDKANPVLARDLERAAQALEERRSATTRFFDAKAGDWDHMRRDILGSLDMETEVRTRMQPCGTAVDVGCGAGHMLPILQEKASRVVGVDSSGRMLEEARKRLGDGQGVSLRLGSMEYLPMRDAESDFALCSMVLHHLPDPARGLKDAFRVLAPGGRLVVVELDKHEQESMREEYGDHWLGFDGQQLAEWLQSVGFELADHATYKVETEYTKAKGLGVHILTARRP